MSKMFRKGSLKRILSGVLALAFVAAIVGGIGYIVNKETRSIHPVYSRGSIDSATGNPMKDNTRLITKELFECQGLELDLDVLSETQYQVFYYRQDKSFIGATNVIEGFYAKNNTFDNAAYARILLIPTLTDGDKEIKLWNIPKLASELKVTVLKDQSFEAPLTTVFSFVRDDYVREVGAETYYFTNSFSLAPYVFARNDHSKALENQTVRSISVPVAGVVDHTVDSVFTVSVVEGTLNSGYKLVNSYELIIPANTFEESLGVVSSALIKSWVAPGYPWYEFNVDIAVEKGQTLAFSSPSDTVYMAIRSGFDESDLSDFGCKYPYARLKGFTENLTSDKCSEIYVDIKCIK